MKDEEKKDLTFDVWVRSDKTRKSRHLVVHAESITEAIKKINEDYPVGNGDYSCRIRQI